MLEDGDTLGLAGRDSGRKRVVRRDNGEASQEVDERDTD